MLRKRFKNPIFLIYLLVIYVTAQFCWWLSLIFSLYNKIYVSPEKLAQKTLMLLGEGSVFFLILILGVISILKAFKRERELTKMQENFVLSVTHELKTPISSVKLFLQTLKIRELTPEKREDIYDRSLSEINRLDGLVNNILLARSIENNNFFLDKVNIELGPFIREKVSSLQSSILKSHTVKLNLTETTLKLDKTAFESILVNLLENAAKYSPALGEITVELTENEQFVYLEVKDQGNGISKHKREKVFNKFYREENEMTRQSKGTGLGLYIVKFLVNQHSGTITLEDHKPKGLIVRIIFKK